MPITMIQRSPGMPSQAYDQLIATVGESLRQPPGFLSEPGWLRRTLNQVVPRVR